MIVFEQLKPNQQLYVVEQEPPTILTLELVDTHCDHLGRKKLKLKNPQISFEVEFKDIVEKLYLDKDMAYSVVVKAIFDNTNKYIREITDGYFSDYFDLNNSVEHYKMIHPELFV